MKKNIILLSVLFSTLLFGNTAFGAIIVGRIAHVQGQLYRYMNVDQTWVETFLDSPVGSSDVLATGDASRAEIAFPNSMMLRLGKNVEIKIRNLDDEVAEFAGQLSRPG